MKEIKKNEDGKAFNYLLEIPLAHWTRHAFSADAKSEHISNNMTESFNAWWLKMHILPIVQLFDSFRIKCMVRLHKRYTMGCTWEGRLTPEAKKY